MELHRYPGVEYRDAEEVRRIQEGLLKEHIAYIAGNSRFYHSLLSSRDPVSVNLMNLHSLPFTDKSSFEDNESDLLAVQMSEIVDIVLSSGTTGRPTRVMYTEHDLRRLAYNEEISFASCGITRDDVVLLTCTIDRCFVAGLAYFLGVRSLGAAAIRNGNNSFASHMEMIERMNPTAIVGVPSFIRKLGIFMMSKGKDPRSSGVKRIICIGEPLRSRDMRLLKMGCDIEEIWSARVFSTYASSEIITTFCECTAQKGGHLHPELAIVEIIGEDGDPVPAGVEGEVVVTPLMVEGMPLLRFRTGDVSFLIDEPCECGRTSTRIGPIIGRKKQMIKFKGTTLYPQSIYTVLDEIPGVGDYFISVGADFDLSHELKVHVSLSDPGMTGEEIADRLQAQLRVKPEVCVSTEENIKRTIYSENSRKPKRFFEIGKEK